jgi:CCR4-NOT transcriptional regulation complex NOT5 subunit
VEGGGGIAETLLAKSFGVEIFDKIHEKYQKNAQRSEESIDGTFTVQTHHIQKLSQKRSWNIHQNVNGLLTMMENCFLIDGM